MELNTKIDNSRKKYETIKSFVSKNGEKRISLILHEYIHGISYISEFRDTIRWYDKISELSDYNKEIFFGDVILTVDNIKSIILKNIDNKYAKLTQQKYDKILKFAENIDEDSIMSIAAGMTEYEYGVDEYELAKATNYLDIFLYIFNYIYYTKNIDIESYKNDIIINQRSEYDSILAFYLNNYHLPTDDKFELMYSIKSKKKFSLDTQKYNKKIDDLIKDYKDNDMISDLISKISELKADENYIKSKIRGEKIDKMIS